MGPFDFCVVRRPVCGRNTTDCCFGVYLGAAPSTSMLRHRAKAISTSASLQLTVSGAVLFENSYGLQEGAREGFWPMAACRADVL